MRVREAIPDDRSAWVDMRDALWPGALAEHETATARFFERPDHLLHAVFVAEENGALVGFLELGLRSYAPGCDSSPVPFIEGWYVRPHARGRGIGGSLVRAAERWARAAGYTEIASDVELENEASIAAHRALGYEETDRVVSFRRALADGKAVPSERRRPGGTLI